MRTTYLNTVTSTFYDEDGNLWRDDYPKFIVGGNERIKIILCTKTEGAMVESANPSEWPRDTSYDSIPGISAMLTIDSDHIHYLKGTLESNIFSGDKTVAATFSGDLSAIPSAGVLRLFDARGNAEAIAYSVAFYLPETPKSIIVCGGGAKNPTLVRYIRQQLPEIDVKTAEDLGWDSSAIEAQAFAYLAVRRINFMPSSYPFTTGVQQPCICGEVFSPK